MTQLRRTSTVRRRTSRRQDLVDFPKKITSLGATSDIHDKDFRDFPFHQIPDLGPDGSFPSPLSSFGIIPISVQRSTSSPTATGVISDLEDGPCSLPLRCLSVPQTGGVKRENGPQAEQLLPALNGVSIFYSSKDNRLVSTHSEGTVQLTNSQKIRRCASLQVTLSLRRTGTVLSVGVTDLDGINYIPLLPNSIPFAQLMRSRSLEDAIFKQSMIQIQTIRAMMEGGVMSKHWFRGGRIQYASRDVMMRNAFPALKCSFCPREFTGVDRQRKYARHCKKLHTSTPLLAEDVQDGQITETPAESDIVELPARSARVVSVDEFLLVHEENIPRWETGTLPPGIGIPHGEDEVNAGNEIHTTVSQRVTIPHNIPEGTSMCSSREQPPMGADELASGTATFFWRQDYVPWAQDRGIDYNPPQQPAYDPPQQPASTCPRCNVTYHGSNRHTFLARHMFERHTERLVKKPSYQDTIPILAKALVKPTGEKFWICYICGMDFTGEDGMLNRARHMMSEHAASEHVVSRGREQQTSDARVCRPCNIWFSGRHWELDRARHMEAKHGSPVLSFRRGVILP